MHSLTFQLMMGASALGAYWISALTSVSADVLGYVSIAVGASGNVFACGYGSAGDPIAGLLVKYDSSGSVQWQREIGGDNYAALAGVAVDDSDNAYIAGYYASPGEDAFIAKYNSSGTLQWQRTLNGGAGDYFNGIKADSSGVYVAGYYWNNGLLAKYNSSGTLQWQRSISSSSICYGIDLDASGNVYVVGVAEVIAGVFLWTAKFDSSGTLQWQRFLEGQFAVGASLGLGSGIPIAVGANGLYAVGYDEDNSSGFVVKYDLDGTLQWARNVTNELYGVSCGANDDAFVVGWNADSVFIGKYDSSGALQWQRSLASSSSGLSFGLGTTTNAASDVYVAGLFAVSSGFTDASAFAAKLPSNGSLTGVYSGWTYASSSESETSATYSGSTGTLTVSSGTLTSATSTASGATASFTATTITL